MLRPLLTGLRRFNVKAHSPLSSSLSLEQKVQYSDSSIEKSTLYLDIIDSIFFESRLSTMALYEPFFALASSICDSLGSIQALLNIDPSATLLLFGVFLRFCTLGFSLYSERASCRMQLALKEFEMVHEEYKRTRPDAPQSALEVHRANSELIKKRKRIFQSYKTSNFRCIFSCFSAPVFFVGLSSTTLFIETIPSPSSFVWCSSLASPDPLFILPCVICGLTLTNFELSLSSILKSEDWVRKSIWAARIAAALAIPFCAFFPSGVCLVFVGMNLAGLSQPILLRSTRVRRGLGFPQSFDEGRKW